MTTGRLLTFMLICGLKLLSQTNVLVDKNGSRYLYRCGDNYFEYRPKSVADTNKKFVFDKNYIDKEQLKWIVIKDYKDLPSDKQKLDNPELFPVVFELQEIENKTKTGFTVRLRYWTEHKDAPTFYHYYCIDIKTLKKGWQAKRRYCGTEM